MATITISLYKYSRFIAQAPDNTSQICPHDIHHDNA
jgi:hypothetical protein